MTDDLTETYGDAPPPPVLAPQSIPTTLLDLWEGNPNVMGEGTFTDLIDDISADGFDEPLTVVPKEPAAYKKAGHDAYVKSGKRFTVVSGNHRTKVARVLRMPALPAVVRPEWTQEDAAVKLVRRNLVRGSLDSPKFTQLVDTYLNGIDHSILSRQLGFEDEAAFRAAYKAQEEVDTTETDHTESGASSKGGADVIESLATMISQIMAKHGETADQDFLAFIWKNHTHFLVAMDGRLRNVATRLGAYLQDTGQNINDVLFDVFDRFLNGVEAPTHNQDAVEDDGV